MQDILEICCGLDVHKETVVACLLKGGIHSKPKACTKSFSTLIQGLEELRAWLEEENCHHVAMESTGVSGRAIINHLAQVGKITPDEVDVLVKKRARAKLNDIKLAVNGNMDSLQKDFLSILLKRLDDSYEHLRLIEQKIDEELLKYHRQLEQLDGIPGINKTAAAAVLAEIGIDMAQFKTAEHICSWAGLSPGNYESAGKKVHSYTPWEYLHKENSLRGCLVNNPNAQHLSIKMVLEGQTASRC